MNNSEANQSVRNLDMSFGSMNPEEIVDEMVTRFLSWNLPVDFSPDAGITFSPPSDICLWPTGTNLFDAQQAKSMILYMLNLPLDRDLEEKSV